MRKSYKLAIVGVVAAGLLAVPATFAFAGGGGWKPCGGEARSAEDVRARLGHFEDRALDRVDATDEQRDRIGAILDDTAPRVFSHKQQLASLHEEAGELLVADTVDRAAIEDLRGDAVAAFDAATRDVFAAVADVAEVLTPEQRRELADLLDGWHHR